MPACDRVQWFTYHQIEKLFSCEKNRFVKHLFKDKQSSRTISSLKPGRPTNRQNNLLKYFGCTSGKKVPLFKISYRSSNFAFFCTAERSSCEQRCLKKIKMLFLCIHLEHLRCCGIQILNPSGSYAVTLGKKIKLSLVQGMVR